MGKRGVRLQWNSVVGSLTLLSMAVMASKEVNLIILINFYLPKEVVFLSMQFKMIKQICYRSFIFLSEKWDGGTYTAFIKQFNLIY